jgi:hypothetical protein
MKMFVASLALATLLAFPASAQSYDPDLGTGNIVSWGDSAAPAQRAPARADRAFARVPRGAATSAYGAVTPFGSPVTRNSGSNVSTAREQALRECSGAAAPFKSTTWGTMELHMYRTCMAQRGHSE